MLVPVVTVILPPGRMPRLDSGVLVVTGTVPTPTAGEPVELEELEELADDEVEEPLDPLDDDDELPDSLCSAACTAAVSSELTRLSAMPLAMLALPLASSVIAVPITPIRESSAEEALDWACACDQ